MRWTGRVNPWNELNYPNQGKCNSSKGCCKTRRDSTRRAKETRDYCELLNWLVGLLMDDDDDDELNCLNKDDDGDGDGGGDAEEVKCDDDGVGGVGDGEDDDVLSAVGLVYN